MSEGMFAPAEAYKGQLAASLEGLELDTSSSMPPLKSATHSSPALTDSSAVAGDAFFSPSKNVYV